MKVSKQFRRQRSIASAIGLALTLTGGFSSQAIAQEAEIDLEEVVITGSRIPQNANITSPSPVTQLGADEFLYSGVTRVEDLLNDLPQVTGSNSSYDANGATGTATVDLRDLGPARTLTLINGRRMPVGSPTQGAAGADLNFIPSALVQRVEVVTGGGSATYGSDAIAGVVNFVMKDDIDGFIFDLTGSGYYHDNDNSSAQDRTRAAGFVTPSGSEFDGESYTASIAWGKSFAEGKGNFTAYGTYRDTEPVQQSQRDFSACAYGGRAADNSLSCVGSGTVAEGRFISLDTGVDYIVSGDQLAPYDGTTFNFAPTNYFQRPDERATAGFFAHYDFSDNLTAYAEAGYMNTQTLAQIAPSGSFFNQLPVGCDSPLLSAQQRQVLCTDAGLSGTQAATVLAVKRNVEGGPRADDIELEQTRLVVGLKGQFSESWGFDVSANVGKVTLDEEYLNDLSITNIGRSLDVVTDPNTGEAVCRSALNGTDPRCVPWNIFQTGGVTDAAIDYLTLPLTQQGDTRLSNVIGYVTGDLTDYGWIVPGASNGVQVVAGLEYRKEELNFNPDANYRSGDGAGQGGPTPGVNGSFSANELFLEAQVPLTDLMNLGLGYRYSDYSTDQTTNAYKATFDWQLVRSVKLRSSYQAASRAANVRELFRPQGIGLFSGSDPCDGTPTASADQCARSGVSAAQFGNILENPAGQYNNLQGGNPNLEPEESDTYSLGFVIQPEAVPGLDITVDWFSIDVQGAISTAGAQFSLDSCVFSGEFCDNINRGPNGTLWLGTSNIVDTSANIGFEEREGIDLAVNYGFEAGNLGTMRLSYNAAFATTYNVQPVPDAAIIDCAGKYAGNCSQPNPEYRHVVRLAYDVTDNVTTTLAWRHSGKVEEDTTNPVVERIPSEDYFDLAALWNLNDKTSLRFGINNIFDTDPFLSGVSGVFTNGNVEVTEYDVLGRYVFAGANYAF